MSLKPRSHSGQTPQNGQKLLMYGILVYFFAIALMALSNLFLEGTPEEPVTSPLFVAVLASAFLFVAVAAMTAATRRWISRSWP